MNVINAIINLVNNPVTQLVNYYQGKNRANNAGDALEEYIKDLFANTFDCAETERLEALSRVFSYLGNNSNPPDAMLRGGDAVEVKKIESDGAALALNSSYPKHTVRSSSNMISSACKQAEQWTEKDIIYAVGVVNNNNLKRLCMVYGLDYCASDECYSRIRKTIKDGVEAIPGVEFAESRELGHINRVDPLGITYMRVRSMWGIENPWRVFSYVYTRDLSSCFDFMCIINSAKWNTFDNTAELTALSEQNDKLRISDVKVKNPDNPAQLVDAKLITFSK
ncbi:MAG: NgoPII family restriction endonuclease [Oscillospiraceae bacterium]|nr:NgoPII family restriction endonuclease [Oscillospiraceae bacterium]